MIYCQAEDQKLPVLQSLAGMITELRQDFNSKKGAIPLKAVNSIHKISILPRGRMLILDRT
jgi:hypothetical protein